VTWFKVDDSLAFHRKTVAAGNAAMGLWVRAGAWSAHQMNDGIVPASMVKSFGATPAQVKSLIEVGLWLEEDGAFVFHDWEKYQPTSTEVRAERLRKSEIRAKAGRAGGLASGVSRKANAAQDEANGQANAKQNEAKPKQSPSNPLKQNEAPTRPDPTRPVPALPEEANPPPPSEVAPPPKTPKVTRRTAVPASFPPDDETAEKCADWAARVAPGVVLRSETEHWLDYHRARGNTAADWTASWRTWMTRAQKDVDRSNGGRSAPNARQSHNDQVLRGVLDQGAPFGQQELSA